MWEVAGCQGLWQAARSRHTLQAEAWERHLGWRQSVGGCWTVGLRKHLVESAGWSRYEVEGAGACGGPGGTARAGDQEP